MDKERIEVLTDIYLTAYMAALNKTKNSDLAVQAAMGVTALVNINWKMETQPKRDIEIVNPIDIFMAAIQQQRQETMEETEDSTGKDGNSEQ